ncbi:hypothetical protein AB0J74_20220 [Asanoa sp. NPDC049573]|uniref:hypothetical protein n=1 Tax=Asanoa sp. NPDC049573 TaxID=3155396 RepID=UPI003449BCFD
MNDRLTGALRQTFEQLADDGGPPSGLARAALAGARRRRRAQVGASVGLALCAVLAAGLAVGGDRGAPVASGPGDSVVVAYSGIRDVEVEDGSPAFNYSMLLDQKTGTYRRVPFRTVIPSPDGERVLVGIGDNSADHPTRLGIMDRATGVVRWMPDGPVAGFPGDANDGAWSPDGRQILFRFLQDTGPSGAVLVDTETLSGKVVQLPYLSVADIGMAWTPDSNGFAVTLADSPTEASAYTARGVQFFGLDGRARRTLAMPDPDLSARPVFSPGGQLALSGPFSGGQNLSIVVVDPDTGAVRARIALAEPAIVVGWADEGHLVVDTYGTRKARQLQVVDLTGAVTRRMAWPDGFIGGEVFIGPAAGLPRSADRLTF